MARKRMLDPTFWRDSDVKKLTRDERLLFIGCISNADDEGRLLAHPAYLKSQIFMYDADLDENIVLNMRDSVAAKMNNFHLYQVDGEEYIQFLKWHEHQKPSYPTASKLPPPPKSSISSFKKDVSDKLKDAVSEGLQESVTPSPGQSSQGEESKGKESSGEDKVGSGDVPHSVADFGHLDSKICEKDLIDILMTELTKNMNEGKSRGAQNEATYGIGTLKEFWEKKVGPMTTEIFEGGLKALQEYPVEVVAESFVKAAQYKGGKHQSSKYIKTILEEKFHKHLEKSK
jgi:hypothetical protein